MLSVICRKVCYCIFAENVLLIIWSKGWISIIRSKRMDVGGVIRVDRWIVRSWRNS